MSVDSPDLGAAECWAALAEAVAERGPAGCQSSQVPESWWSPLLEVEARRVCRGCPVRVECLAYALAADERHGVWGGLTGGSGGSFVVAEDLPGARVGEGYVSLFIRGSDVVVPARKTGAMLAWLIPVLRDQVAASGWCLVVPDDVVGFLEALHAVDVARERRPMSDSGHASTPPAIVEDVRSPEDAGAVVGLSARHVRRLCRAGLVESRPSGARSMLVDVDSLRDYLRGVPA